MDNYLLQIKDVSKSFTGVKALDKVSLNVRPGTIHSLMGENGAGKSTLMKCLFGIYIADSGEFVLDGKKVNFANAKQAMENGVSMVHQELNQVHTRSVMENIWLGRFPGLPPFYVSHKKMYQDTLDIFKKLDIPINPKAIIRSLSVSQRQMVEIAKAVSHNSKIIVFDEPTSSLTDVEVEHLFRIIGNLRDQGCGIIYISHRMSEILRISDEVTVMRDGKVVNTSPASSLTTDKIITMMVGRELDNVYPVKDNVPGEVVFKAEGLTAQYVNNLKNVSFELRKGEILGVAGLLGSGRTETLESIFGLVTLKYGKIYKNGAEIKTGKPERAKKHRFALLTEERRSTGIFSILSVRDNITVANIADYLRMHFYVSGKKMSTDADWAIQTLKIKTPSQKNQIRSLSGGNQQKVIFGRWLLTKPDILLLDEPTRGIDVGAKYEIYQLMIALAKQGKSIIMVSSELPELLGVCDRIIVMSGGFMTGDLDAKVTSQEEIMTLAAKYA